MFQMNPSRSTQPGKFPDIVANKTKSSACIKSNNLGRNNGYFYDTTLYHEDYNFYVHVSFDLWHKFLWDFAAY